MPGKIKLWKKIILKIQRTIKTPWEFYPVSGKMYKTNIILPWHLHVVLGSEDVSQPVCQNYL